MELNPLIALAIAALTLALNVGSMLPARQTVVDRGLPSFGESRDRTVAGSPSRELTSQTSVTRQPSVGESDDRTTVAQRSDLGEVTPQTTVAQQSDLGEPSTETSSPESSSSRRHNITCNVTTLDDVKVVEKQTVVAGQTLCDRTEARSALEAKKQQIELALSQQPISIPVTPLMELPPADFSSEEFELTKARAELARLEGSPPLATNHYEPWMASVTEPEAYNRQIQYQQDLADARYAVAEAMAHLNRAKALRQQEELMFLQQQQLDRQQLLLEQQRSGQQQSYQKAQLLNDLQDIEEKIEQITAIQSPYSGSIRRVKILGQSDRNIQVEVSLIADTLSPSSSP